VCFKCSAKWPSMSASTAVRLSDRMGISMVFMILSWRLNSFEIIKASAFEGTANVCRYGVFMTLSSKLRRYLDEMKAYLCMGWAGLSLSLKVDSL
jgi:hypothetical protein